MCASLPQMNWTINFATGRNVFNISQKSDRVAELDALLKSPDFVLANMWVRLLNL